MSIPERLWRFPTASAIRTLAERFGLPNDPDMQDWEYQVADPSRLAEFLHALETESFSDDERFTLTETVMECFEELSAKGNTISELPEWHRFASLLRNRPLLHAWTLHYWSCEEFDLDEAFRISALVRPIWTDVKPHVGIA